MASSKSGAGEFSTSDLYFAAYLQTAGVELKRTDRRADTGKVFFVFDATVSNIDELKAAWFNNTGKVVANAYAYQVKNLKSLCHTRLVLFKTSALQTRRKLGKAKV